MGSGRVQRGLILVAFTCLCFSAATLRAAESKIVEVGSLSVASLSRLSAEARDLGIKLPPILTAEGIERQFRFIPPGGLDVDRPIGLFFFAGTSDHSVERNMAIAFPMKKGIAPLKSFLDQGGKPLGGGSGAVELNGAFFRRTALYLIWSHSAPAVVGVRDAELLDPYRSPQTGRDKSPDGVLIRFTADLAAQRQVDAARGQQLLNGLKYMAGRSGYSVATDLATSLASQVNRFDAAIVRNRQELSLKIGVAPLRVPAGGTFARPGMPQEVIARLDLGAPPLQVLPWAESVYGKFLPGVRNDDFFHNLLDILLGGQAVSIGLEPRGDYAIFYVVQQHVKADPIARLKQLAEQSNLAASYATEKTKAKRMDFGQYYTSERGLHVSRVKFMEGDTSTLCVDVVRQGDTVFLTASSDLGRYMQSLIELKPQGQFSGLASGSISLGAALEIISDAAGQNGLPREKLKQLREIFKGQMLTLSATGGADEAVFGITVDGSVIKDLIAMFYQSAPK